MKSAVCLLVPSADAKTFLSVSRRNDTTRWGLPGGKVDVDETNLQAAVREVTEEIGIALAREYFEPLFCDVCPGKGPDDTYWVTTYVWTGSPLVVAPQPEEGLTAAWLCESALTDPRRSPFAGYNQGVFNAWRVFAGAL